MYEMLSFVALHQVAIWLIFLYQVYLREVEAYIETALGITFEAHTQLVRAHFMLLLFLGFCSLYGKFKKN